MSLLENIKKTLIDGGEKVVKAAEDITGKIREAGEHGWDISKEVLAEISEKTADITNIARYKLELKDLQKNIDAETINLGELAWAFYSAKNKEKSEKKIQAQIENIENLKRDLLDKTTKYEDLRKIYSQDFIVQNLIRQAISN